MRGKFKLLKFLTFFVLQNTLNFRSSLFVTIFMQITDLNLAVNAHIFALLRFPNFRFFAQKIFIAQKIACRRSFFNEKRKNRKFFISVLSFDIFFDVKMTFNFYFLKDDATPMIISEEQLLMKSPPMINATTILVKLLFDIFFGKFTHLETNSWQPYVILLLPQQRLFALFVFFYICCLFFSERNISLTREKKM